MAPERTASRVPATLQPPRRLCEPVCPRPAGASRWSAGRCHREVRKAGDRCTRRRLPTSDEQTRLCHRWVTHGKPLGCISVGLPMSHRLLFDSHREGQGLQHGPTLETLILLHARPETHLSAGKALVPQPRSIFLSPREHGLLMSSPWGINDSCSSIKTPLK